MAKIEHTESEAAVDDAQVEAKRPERPKFAIRLCAHDKGEYSLRIRIPFGHVHMESHSYDLGNDVIIFRMQPEDIINMGHAILTAGIKLPEEA